MAPVGVVMQEGLGVKPPRVLRHLQAWRECVNVLDEYKLWVLERSVEVVCDTHSVPIGCQDTRYGTVFLLQNDCLQHAC